MADKNSSVASIGMGLAVGALVGIVFQHAMPTLIDHRVGNPDDPHASSALRTATWTSIGIVTATAALANDWTVFVVGGAVTVGFNLWHRHANMVVPETGRAIAAMGARSGEMSDGLSPDMAYNAAEA